MNAIQDKIDTRIPGISLVASAILAMAAMAVFLWSADLARDRGPARWTGVLGLAAGAALVVALPTGIGHLDLAGMTLVLVVWTVWFVAVGTLMIQRKV